VADQITDRSADHRTAGECAGCIGVSAGSNDASAGSGTHERAQYVARFDFLTTAARHRETEAQ
jgi:uncharacterized membrane protein